MDINKRSSEQGGRNGDPGKGPDHDLAETAAILNGGGNAYNWESMNQIKPLCNFPMEIQQILIDNNSIQSKKSQFDFCTQYNDMI